MSVKLELYRVFKEVAEAGNITAAAQTLFISQSAVSTGRCTGSPGTPGASP